MTRTETAPTARALAPDLARGMMLLFIVLANVSWHLYDRPTLGMTVHLVDGSVLDKVLQTIMTIAVDARSYPMFAFLVGYSMVQFARSRRDRGVPEQEVRRQLRRRNLALLLMGFLHAALLFAGDILGAYGLAGLVLVWLFFTRRDRTLAIWCIAIAAVAILGTLFTLAGGILTAIFSPEAAAMGGAGGFAQARDYTAGAASYPASVLGRIIGWLIITPGQLLTGSIVVCILLGWLAARHRVLEEPGRQRRLVLGTAIGGILVGWLGGLPAALHHLGALPLDAGFSWAFAGLTPVTGIAGGLGYAALFALLAERWTARPPAPVRAIAAVGRRSLTFYLLQSVILAPLFGAWGLGLGATLGTAQALGIAALVWLVSIPLAVWMDRTGRRGPAETLLRRLTMGRPEGRGPGTPATAPPLAAG